MQKRQEYLKSQKEIGISQIYGITGLVFTSIASSHISVSWEQLKP